MHGLNSLSPEAIASLTAEEAVYAAEREIARLPQVEVEPVHQFADGLYARTILIPAGCAISGFIHKQSDLNIVHSGIIDVIGTDGIARRIEGPHMFVGQAGLKKVGIAITDVSWTNVFATTETDIEKLEQELFEMPSEEQTQPQFSFSTGKIIDTSEASRELSHNHRSDRTRGEHLHGLQGSGSGEGACGAAGPADGVCHCGGEAAIRG